jgi:hypothetical protein
MPKMEATADNFEKQFFFHKSPIASLYKIFKHLASKSLDPNAKPVFKKNFEKSFLCYVSLRPTDLEKNNCETKHSCVPSRWALDQPRKKWALGQFLGIQAPRPPPMHMLSKLVEHC